MKKLIVILLTFVFISSFPFVVSAKQDGDSNDSGIPEKNGDYPDPKHPGVRVRVFVHGPKDKTQTTTAAICADPDASTSVSAAGWKLPAGTWRYNLNPGSVPASVGTGNLATIATNAFNTWQNTQSKVTFSSGPTTTVTRSSYDGKNIVAWGRTSGTALGVTYIRYYTNTGLAVDVDTIMNKKFPWSWTPYGAGLCGNPNSYDAQNILVHELGHWMGLDDEYDASLYTDHTMFGYGDKGEIKKDTLTTGDTNGVKAIYP